MSEPNVVGELERLWQGLAKTQDQSDFVAHLRVLQRLRYRVLGPEMSGRAIEWLSRIDHLVYRRTRRGAYSLQTSGLTAVVWLALLCLPWPLFIGLAVGGMLALRGSPHAWEAGLGVLVALYVGRLGHELGHLVAGLPVFCLRGIYASYNLGELRLELGVRVARVRVGQLIRMYLGGALVNLALGLIGLVAFVSGVWRGTLALSFLSVNLALGLGNLVPLRWLGPDGYSAYRTWRVSRVARAQALPKGGQP